MHKRALALLLVIAATACAGPPPQQERLNIVYPPPPDQPRYYYEGTILSSLDVQEESSSARFKRFATGASLRGAGFSKPFGIAVTEGRLFIGDTVARHIAAFDFPRKRYYEFGNKGLGRLAKPLGMAVDRMGRIYVCDGTSKRVMIYDLDGAFIAAVGGGEYFDRPSGVAVNADGSKIYVVDTGGVDSENHRVRVFDQAGAHLFDIGSRGNGPGEFNLPLMATTDREGRLYVTDTGNFRVQVFSPDGELIESFGEAGRYPGQFSHPKGVAVDHEGKVFVVDTSFANFQIFNQDGRILMHIGERDEGGGAGNFILPSDIAVDVDGRVYVVDQFFRKVDVFRPAALPAESPLGLPLAQDPAS